MIRRAAVEGKLLSRAVASVCYGCVLRDEAEMVPVA